ncbi:hypothetical protein [Polaribacter sargassicola]|uniref:hypothetical protein n=1 Tax=Polaribacter sargassicola TaxID=2836891 RepID=UPI001F35AA1E|nr:hypothetical protein [Polaribacter sp. DS7-9]MCG1037621.1 hypothetical protein [Polaribacter sp. DS7-9]
MKNILIFIIFILSYHIQSQDKGEKELLFKLQNKKVNININKDIFTNVTTNMYAAQEPKALIVALYLPISYKKQKTKLNKISNSSELKFIGEKTIKGEKILLKEGIISKKGINYLKQVYYLKYDKKTCIELTTMLVYSASKRSKKMIDDIVYSVIEKN